MNAPTDAVTDKVENKVETSEVKAEKKSAADERIAQLEEQLARAISALESAATQQQAPPPNQGPAAPTFDFQGTPMQGEPGEKPRNMMTLAELRDYPGILYVKHNDPVRQFSCHQALGEHRVDFDLAPAGRPDAIGIMPKLALEIRGIQRAWKRGVITISTDKAMEREIDLAMDLHGSYQQETLAALQAPLEKSNNEKDIITRPCLRCGRWGKDQYGQRTAAIEGGKAMQTWADYKAGIPPLCAAHAHEEHLWVGTLVKDQQTGNQDWQYGSMVVGETRPGVPTQDPYTGPLPDAHMNRYYQ